ncbi:MAG TPA: SDR family NAD(P)-dependent oxidoreductase, partial [Afipia sp.]
MTDRVTLITGASSGIGAELARIFAAKGHRVALVARRADKLAELAGGIVAAGGAQPAVIVCDLQKNDAGDIITSQLQAQNLEVDFLVN